MAEGNRSQFESQGRQSQAHFASLAVRSIGQVYDMNLSAARVLLQTQARAASAFGLPDWSGLFNSVDERARHVFSTGADQFVITAQRASEAATELQREVGRVVETQATTVAETLKHGFEELGSQASEGFDQLVETARQQAEEAERVASSISDEMREAIDDAGNQARESTQRAGAHQREAIQRGGHGAAQAANAGKDSRSGEEKDKGNARKLAA